jgi:glucokinase
VQLDADGRLCPCGMRGCPEMYVSGLGLRAGVREHAAAYPHSALAQVAEPSTEHIVAAARAQDALALAVMDEARDWLFRTLAYCTSLFNPALLVIGGGLGLAAPEFFIRDAQEQIARRTVPMSHHTLRVQAAQVTNSAVGAACLVWHALDQTTN